MKTAVVLGAGIQGLCVAFLLKKHGYQVTVLDRGKDIFHGASLNQEGKVHLGFVYGMDTSMSTGKKMIRDAFTFGEYLEYLLDEKIQWDRMKSKPFDYLVHRDSFLGTGSVATYFSELQEFALKWADDSGQSYLGEGPESLYQTSNLHKDLNPDAFRSCFRTKEVAIDQNNLKALFLSKLSKQDQIKIVLNRHVVGVEERPGGFVIDCIGDHKQAVRINADRVFNCLWDGRGAIDRAVGVNDEDSLPYSLRFKFGIVISDSRSSCLQDMDSFTIIQGAFGDFVSFPETDRRYFCWYPCSMKGMTNDVSPPPEWRDWCDGEITADFQKDLADANHRAYKQLIPDLLPFENVSIRGGIIVARGARDITDERSRLHARDADPITRRNEYFSIDTGKFTSAPRNAQLLEKLIS